MSRFSRAARRGKKGGKRKDPPEPKVETHAATLDRVACWDSGRLASPMPTVHLRKIDRQFLDEHDLAAWKYRPGTFHLGGGWRTKPDMLTVDAAGVVSLVYLADKPRSDVVDEAAALQAVHPWFRVACYGAGLVPYTVKHYRPPTPTARIGDIEEGMSGLEREHVGRLDDWKSRGWIGGWLYEPVSWRLGGRRHYTPDFLVFGCTRGSSPVAWHEVKGHQPMPDAEVKLAMFPVLYPFFRVELHQKKRDPGESSYTWHGSEVPPGLPYGFSG